MKKLLPVLSVLLILFVLVACGKQEEPAETMEAQPTTYDVVGLVVSMDQENNTITIAHKDIPNFMNAMTMGFQVKDTTLMGMVQPEDSVQFELTVEDEEMWISNIEKIEEME